MGFRRKSYSRSRRPRRSRHTKYDEKGWRKDLDEVKAEELDYKKPKKHGKFYKYVKSKAHALDDELKYRRAAEAQIKKKSKAAYYEAKEKAMVQKMKAKAKADAQRPSFLQSIAAGADRAGRGVYKTTQKKGKRRKRKATKKPFNYSPLDNMPDFGF